MCVSEYYKCTILHAFYLIYIYKKGFDKNVKSHSENINPYLYYYSNSNTYEHKVYPQPSELWPKGNM